MSQAEPCPCGRGRSYGECCQPLHQGQSAANAEDLMRSRYAAFVLGLDEYLRQSWHPDSRPTGALLDNKTEWLGLEVLNHVEDPSAAAASVEFVARFRAEGQFQQLHETSRFVRLQGHWLYLDGVPEWQVLQPGRNDVCPCGSGRKYKKCCGQ